LVNAIYFTHSSISLSGHNLNQRMQLALRKALPQLTSGLPNWRGYPRYLATRAANTEAVGK